jgi:hypothetical protein
VDSPSFGLHHVRQLIRCCCVFDAQVNVSFVDMILDVQGEHVVIHVEVGTILFFAALKVDSQH